MNKNNVRKGNIRRRRRNTGNGKTFLLLCILILAVFAIAAAVYFIAGGKMGVPGAGKTPESQIQETETDKLIVMSIEEDAESVIVETSYGQMRYPYSFSDIIKIEPINYGQYSELKFNADISGKTIPLYSLRFNHDSGIPAAEMVLPISKEKIGVSVEFYEPDGLSEEETTVFYAALETFNDVLDSFAENENFEKLDYSAD